ncbi:hypothetical protein GCM10010341_50180 [Streptomyces noursei]|nr:hypothetical protein GCM10010341_50180 [Streptomyces noursei]
MGFDALAFHASELGEVGAGWDSAFAEAFFVHRGGDGEALVVVGPGAGLAFEPGGGEGVGEGGGVAADAAGAGDQAGGAVAGEGGQGAGGDGGAGAQEDAAEGGGGEVEGFGAVAFAGDFGADAGVVLWMRTMSR